MHQARYLIRRIFRSSGFSTMVVVTIGLAVGVNLGVFSITQSILLHSLGVPEAKDIIHYTLGGSPNGLPLSGPCYEALRSSAAMKDILAWKTEEFRLQTPTGTAKIYGAFVTGNAFTVFGLIPSLGRFFNGGDDAPGGGKDGWEAVLGYSYWKTHFDADPHVIGQTVTVDGAPVHIVGVLPREFTGISPLVPADILLPRHFLAVSSPGQDRFAYPGYFEWMVFGRLPQGVSMREIQTNLDAIGPSIRQSADPEGKIFAAGLFSNLAPGALINVEDGRLGATSGLKALHMPLLAMEALAATLFLFCCCNLILLFVGRASREAHTAAIRMALGARLGNEVRFAMFEATVLAAIGCMVAAPVAWSTAHILSRVLQSIPGFDTFPTISPNTDLLVEAVGITLAVACVAGAGASLWQERKRPSLILRAGIRSATLRSNSWIIGFEVFASVLLITAALVCGVGFEKLAGQPSGFPSVSAVLATLDIEEETPSAGADSSKESRIVEQIERSPGIQSVATMNLPPISGSEAKAEFAVRGKNGAMRPLNVWPAEVSIHYFSSVGTRIVRGRDFTANDLAGESVCILGSRAALAWFAGENPLENYIYSGADAQNEAAKPYCRVVGIAEDVHFKSMSDPVDIVVYRLTTTTLPTIVVKATSSRLAIEAVRNAVQAIAPASLDAGIGTIQMHIDDDLRVWRVITLAGTLCAWFAAIILGVGVFGILSIQVADQQREIGIQIALGANRTQVCLAVIKKLRRVLFIGLILGSVAALLAAARLAQVYGLSTQYVIGGYLGSLALLGFLLLAAAFVPLRRALGVSPAECLASD